MLKSGKPILLKNMAYTDFVIIIIGLEENCFWKNRWSKCLKIPKLIYRFVLVGPMNRGQKLG